jgi:polyisoprenoid-binding protein YceI
MKTAERTTTGATGNAENLTKWVVDPAHSEFLFKVKHMMISTVTGRFESFNATVEAAGDDFTKAAINVEVDVDSINTNNEDRNNHLKSDDFFNAERFPRITFSSTYFDGEKLTGDLTIRDVTKEVSLQVESNGIAVDPYGQTKAGFELAGEISRKEFGLMWDVVTEAGSVVVSDKVKMVIDIQFIRQD